MHLLDFNKSLNTFSEQPNSLSGVQTALKYHLNKAG